jgi:uncharacterized membrane protein YfcA
MEWLLGIAVGLSVGALGIGGVLMVPVLSLVFGHSIEVSIATASTSFLLPACVAVAEYHRRGAIPWDVARPLCLAIVPGVLVGVGLGLVLPTTALVLATSVLLLAAGVQALAPGASAGTGSVPRGPAALVMSASVGAASSLTGTGGPVLLSPILLRLRVPVRTVVGVSQAITLPVAAMASIAYAPTGRVDFELAAVLGLCQALAIPLGASVAQRVPIAPLHSAVAISIIVSALLLALRGVGALTSS